MARNYRHCDFDGCNRKHEAKGYCQGHYQQFRRGQRLTTLPMDYQVTCIVPECDDSRYNGTRYCWEHTEVKHPGAKGQVNCLLSGCEATYRTMGLCDNHYWTANKYRLSVAQYQMILDQGCEICGSTDRISVDHDHACCPGAHTCGECLRGVLCGSCNSALGYAGDNPERLVKLANYILGTNYK